MDTTASTPTTTKRASRKVRGTGSIYQRGEIWWIRYWHRGELQPGIDGQHGPH